MTDGGQLVQLWVVAVGVGAAALVGAWSVKVAHAAGTATTRAASLAVLRPIVSTVHEIAVVIEEQGGSSALNGPTVRRSAKVKERQRLRQTLAGQLSAGFREQLTNVDTLLSASVSTWNRVLVDKAVENADQVLERAADPRQDPLQALSSLGPRARRWPLRR